jgi:membrane protease YdiL (CAAX protease family)
MRLPAAPFRIDPHLIAALLAAVPVWAALGLWAGPWLRAPAGAWGWFSLVLLMPLLEEGVFRGLLQGQLLRVTAVHGQPRRWGPISWANGLTTLAFVALHLPNQPMLWALAVAAPSLVLGHLRERLGSAWPAVGVHAFYNAGFALVAVSTQG